MFNGKLQQHVGLRQSTGQKCRIMAVVVGIIVVDDDLILRQIGQSQYHGGHFLFRWESRNALEGHRIARFHKAHHSGGGRWCCCRRRVCCCDHLLLLFLFFLLLLLLGCSALLAVGRRDDGQSKQVKFLLLLLLWRWNRNQCLLLILWR